MSLDERKMVAPMRTAFLELTEPAAAEDHRPPPCLHVAHRRKRPTASWALEVRRAEPHSAMNAVTAREELDGSAQRGPALNSEHHASS